MSSVKVRFAPSPTGYLHVGNVRTALVNWLFTRKQGGKFLLRMDDTDRERSEDKYEVAIREDMLWLGLDWDEEARQTDRLDRYEAAKQKLLADGRLYPCYETPDELEVKRKFQLSRGLPPIYDRSALKLTEEQKAQYEAEGRTPHYRFKLLEEEIHWQDMVRGEVKFHGRNLADPILLREDGKPTYTLSSVVDDGELEVTHVMRGEDHVSNTAVQVQLFEALGHAVPGFAHFSLIKSKEGELSKRHGKGGVALLREEGIEALALLSLLARLGTSEPVVPATGLQQLIDGFDVNQFGRAPALYDPEDLQRLNEKVLAALPFDAVQERLAAQGLEKVDAHFWEAVRPNIGKLADVSEWWRICRGEVQVELAEEDRAYSREAAALLPQGEWDDATWKVWTASVKEKTGRKGKALFLPLRKALTGMDHGPELDALLPLIGPERARERLSGKAA